MNNLSFTASEYLHLAVDAMSRNEHHPALAYLKEAIAIEPNNVPARQALSSLYLKLGMAQRGADELEQCARLAPDFEVVRFQLAGLCWRLGRQEDAKRYYGELATSEDAAVAAYSGAMLKVAEGLMEAAADTLRRGLADVSESHPLKGELTTLLYAVFTTISPSGPSQHAPPMLNPAYLGAYAKAGSAAGQEVL